MSYPTVFANLAAGNQPISLLDTMFIVGGEQGNVPCTAVGTNAITLTPNTNFFLPAAYVNKQMVTWRAVATSSGPVTIQIGALALVKLFTVNAIQCNAGDIVTATTYTCVFDSALDSGNGGFIIVNGTVTAIGQPPVGSYTKKLIQNNAGVPNSQIDVTIGELVVENSLGGTLRTTGLSSTVTLNLGVTGVNALDTGVVAASKIYFIYGIVSPTSGTATLASLSPTSPATPGGYTYKALAGAFQTDASANLYRQRQRDDHWWVVLATGTNTTEPINIFTGATGSYSPTTPTWGVPTLTGVVPFNGATPMVSEIQVLCSPSWHGAGAQAMQVAPSNNYLGYNSATGATPYYDNVNNTLPLPLAIWMPVETTGIAVAQGSTCAIHLVGFRFSQP